MGRSGVLPLRMALPTVITILFAWMFDATDLMLLIIMIESIAQTLSFDVHTIGAGIISVALLTSGIGGITFGYLADRWGRKKTLWISILTYSIPTFLVAFVHTWVELLLLRLISGFGVGGAWAAGMTLIAETVHPEDRGKAVGIVQCGFPVGFLFAIFLASFAALTPGSSVMYANWRIAFILAAIPALILSLIVKVFVPESKIWKFRIHRGSKYSIKDIFVHPTYRRSFLIGLALDTLGMFSYWIFWSWLPTYLYKTYNVGVLRATENIVWLAVSQLGALIGYLSYGYIQDKLGRRIAWTTFTFMEGVLMFVSIYLIADLIEKQYVSLTVFMLAGFFLGYFTGFWSAFGAILSELFPTEIRSTASGFAFNIGRSINFVSPILVGYLAAIYGWAPALSLGGIVSIAMSAIVWLLPETKGIDLSKT